MKHFLIIVCLQCLPSNLFAQHLTDVDRLIYVGEDYLEKGLFIRAIDSFEAAVKKDSINKQAQFKLGQAYQGLFDYASAEKHYSLASALEDEALPEATFYSALMNKQRSRYTEAIQGFVRFENRNRGDSSMRELLTQSVKERLGCEYAIEALDRFTRRSHFKLLPEPMNSKFNDYAASSSIKGLVILTSGRSSAKNRVFNRYGDSYTNIYRFESNGTSWINKEDNSHFEKINSQHSDGAAVMNEAGTELYFTNCSERINGKKCHVYMSKKVNGQWQKPFPIDGQINLNDSDSKHPSLNASEDSIFFASNRPGGFGEFDIYVSKKIGDSWVDPVNLGPNINTSRSELSPFYSSNHKTLYFSSNGKDNFGGYDIYRINGPNFSQSEAVNVGMPFNSSSDDVFPFFKDNLGFLSSTRENGMGKFDIYSFDARFLTGEENIDNFYLTSRTRRVEEMGLFALREEDQLFYQNLSEEEKQLLENIVASAIDDPDYVNHMRGEELEFYQKISNQNPGIIDKLIKARMSVIAARAKLDSANLAKRNSFEYNFPADLNMNSNEKEGSVVGIAKSSDSNLYTNLFFDFESSKPQSTLILDWLIKTYKSEQISGISILAFTDSIGNANYNIALSQRRAKSISNYLQANGIPQSMINIEGKGISVQRFAGASNTLLKNQLRRHAEIRLDSEITESFITLVPKKKVSMKNFAEKYDIPMSNIEPFNQKSRMLIAFKPVIVIAGEYTFDEDVLLINN